MKVQSQDDNGLVLIKHYSNFQRLSKEHLQAIIDEKTNLITEIIAQKQIIMDRIVPLQADFLVNECQPAILEKLKELLGQITVSENASQQMIKEHSKSIAKQMLAARKEMSIYNAYDDHSFQKQGNLLNIQK